MNLLYFENNEGNTFFVVNKDGKELVEVSIKSYKVNFSENENGNIIATTFVTIEGNDFEITEDIKYLKLYRSVKEYKEGEINSPSTRELSYWAINSHININGSIARENETKGFTYIFNGIEGVRMEFNIKSIEYKMYTHNIKVINIALDDDFADVETYETLADVYKFNDIMVIKEDGTQELHEGIAKKLMLTDEQSALFEEFKAIVTKIANTPDMRIMLDEDNSTFIALNEKHIVDYYYGERADGEDEIDARALANKQSVDFKRAFTYFSDCLALKIN